MFKVNDHVRMKALAALTGTITDKFVSVSGGETIYGFKSDDAKIKRLVLESEIEHYEEPLSYRHEFEYLDTAVVAKFFEIRGKHETEIARGHGHIIQEGALGIAQASSYALKKLYEKLNGGKV